MELSHYWAPNSAVVTTCRITSQRPSFTNGAILLHGCTVLVTVLYPWIPVRYLVDGDAVYRVQSTEVDQLGIVIMIHGISCQLTGSSPSLDELEIRLLQHDVASRLYPYSCHLTPIPLLVSPDAVYPYSCHLTPYTPTRVT